MVRIEANIRVRLNAADITAQVRQATARAQVILDEQVLKDSNRFIPLDTGELMRSGLRASRIGEGSIVWDTPYARRLYFNPQYNFSRDSNPLAQGLWFEAAKSRYQSHWVELTRSAYREALG